MFKKIIVLILVSLSIANNASALTKTPAKDITTNVSGWGQNIPITATDVQAALDALNVLTVPGTVNWGNIGGLLSNQTDLQNALNSKISGVNWGQINGLINNQNWAAISPYLSRDAMNWNSLNNDIQGSGINWPSENIFVNGPTGNVGIGLTTHPAATLLSIGNSNSAGSLTHNAFNIDSNGNITNIGGIQANINANTVDLTNAGNSVKFGNNSGSAASSVNIHATNTTGYITFSPSSDVERLRIDSSGNLGIGTTTPSAPLDVIGNIHGYGFHSNSTIGGITSQYGINFDPTGGGTLMNMTYGRYIGINNLTPTQQLDVTGTVKMTGFQLPTGAVNNYILTSDGSGIGTWRANSGSVSSVAMTGDGTIFNSTVAGSPITTSGTLVPALLTQTRNTVLVGPASGANAAPTFRALVGADIPNPSATTLGGVESLVVTSHQWINTISTSGVPSSTQPLQADIGGLTTSDSPTFAGLTVSGATVSTPAIFNGSKVLSSGTYSGNTTQVATVSGSLISGNLVKSDASHNVIDTGVNLGTLTDTKLCGYTSATGTISS